MEFTSEMVIKATLLDLKRSEVPVALRPDGRGGSPHLHPWRDGWRHLRYSLMLGPLGLYFIPALLLGTLGIVILALLPAGIGIADVLWPLLAGIGGSGVLRANVPAVPGRGRLTVGLTMVPVTAYVTIAAVVAGVVTLPSLSANEREAMRWISSNTPASSRCLVVTSERSPVDRSYEWFPVLEERERVGTVQGSEWLPGGQFDQGVEGDAELLVCPPEGIDCLERWIRDRGNAVTHVYVPKRRAAL